MSVRTLFNIILKILGLLFIKDILAEVPQLISFIYFFKRSDSGAVLIAVMFAVFSLLFYGLVAYYFIFRSELIIHKLKLEEGFDEDPIPLNIHRSTVLSIAIIVIGGLMVANEIPNLCLQLFSYLQQKKMTFGQTNPSLTVIILPAVKILIGLLLARNQRQLVNWIERNRK